MITIPDSIKKLGDYKLYSPMPKDFDTRPAELITFLPQNEPSLMSELKLELMLFNAIDSHRLIENYSYSKMKKMICVTLMKRDDLIVGFSGIQEMKIGNRILSRLYQSSDNRVSFSREIGRPTLVNMVNHQCIIADKLNLKDIFISREPRGSMKHVRSFIDKLNSHTMSEWAEHPKLLETVEGSMQHIFWRIK